MRRVTPKDPKVYYLPNEVNMSKSVHKEVVNKLEEVLEIVKELPQGYQYKVRELCACVETVVSMYDDVQRGVIPEVLVKMRNGEPMDEIPEEHHKEQEVESAPVAPAGIEISKPIKQKLVLGSTSL